MSKPFVKYGLMAGTATIALFLLLLLLRPAAMFHPVVWWGSLLIYLTLMWVAGRRARQHSDTPLGFRQMMQQVFPVFVVANALFYLFWYVLLATRPDLVQIQYDILTARGWEGSIELLRPTLAGTLLMLLQSFVGGAVLSALLAWALKEE
ncbi:MAG: DUF4199 family protein [Deltaproteobacteria bacterium]|nr:MAG: DUF4199 family protein [Deltaproteobacteria bacterium]